MPRGISESDVFDAANAILARGERPTIERVRQELGRGSPNTVNRLLDGWWAQLAARMGATVGASRLPPALQAAMEKVYDRAMADAREKATQELGHTQGGLQAQQEALALREQALTSREAGIQASLEALRVELATSSVKTEHVLNKNRDLESTLKVLSSRTERAEKDLERAQQRLSVQEQKHSQELSRRLEQARLSEDRLLRQIDALRTDLKEARAEKLAATKSATSRSGVLEARIWELQKQLGAQNSSKQAPSKPSLRARRRIKSLNA